MSIRSQVNAKALAFPSIFINGKKLKPVVVKTQQVETQTEKASQLKKLQTLFNKILRTDQPTVEAKVSEKKFPLRLFHLVDVSTSMAKNFNEAETHMTRLQYVKDTIEKLLKQIPEDIKAGIEHILIPFSKDTGPIKSFKFNDEEAFLDALGNLQISAGTNFFYPIDGVTRYIKQYRDELHRNLIIFFSDGKHKTKEAEDPTKKDTLNKFANLIGFNSALFNVGIGESYERSFMLDSLRKAQHGGLAHLPNNQVGLNLFQNTLPNFIKDLTTAPKFPIISFNSYFDRVINMSPTARQIKLQSADNYTSAKINAGEHFESVTGYQNEAFSVGFIEEDKINQGKIFKLVKDQANSQNCDEAKELSIQDFNETTLNPSERKQFQEYLFVSLKNLLLESLTPKTALEVFLEQNEVSQPIKEELETLIEQLDSIKGNKEALMSLLASHSILNTETKFQDTKDIARAKLVETKTDSANNNKNLVLTLSEHRGGLQSATIKIKNGETKTIGRHSTSDLMINDESVSRNHAEISFNGDILSIEDKDSTNHTKVNGSKIEAKTELRSADTITLGNKTFIINF